MSDNNTPGVYIEELNNLPMSISPPVATVPVFIGQTVKVPKDAKGKNKFNQPMKIDNLTQYIDLFGKACDQEFKFTHNKDDTITGDTNKLKIHLYHHMQLYFDNGGGTCYVSCIDSKEREKYNVALEQLKTKDDITLIILADVVVNESVEDKYFNLVTLALKQCQQENQFLLVDVKYKEKLDDIRKKLGNDNLQYGAAYTPYLNTSLKYYQYNDDEIVIVTVKKSVEKNIPTQYILKRRIGAEHQNPDGILDNIIQHIKSAAQKITIENMPPSGAIAGIYARVEREHGVWQSPANVIVNDVLSPVTEITKVQQEILNFDPKTGKSINAIRQFIDRGILVWGARTLAGNDNNWRYICVRRTISYVERTVKEGLQSFVFEANIPMNWLKINTMVSSFLKAFWQNGGLTGATEKDAFFINIGLGTTMTPRDILEGRLNIKIGLAAVRPAEFIIVEFSQMLQKS